MNDDKKIGFSAELENGRVDMWAHGEGETLVNLAVAATAHIVAEVCGNDKEESKKLLQDVKIGLDTALDQALKTDTDEIVLGTSETADTADQPTRDMSEAWTGRNTTWKDKTYTPQKNSTSRCLLRRSGRGLVAWRCGECLTKLAFSTARPAQIIT